MARQTPYHHGDLRAALVSAALELAAAKGVAGVSVAEAARRAGVSSAAPYRHFAGRTALLSAAAVEAARRLAHQMRTAAERARPEETGDEVAAAIETLATLAGAYVRYTHTHRVAFELILADELHDFPDQQRREVVRELFDLLLWPAITITGDPTAAEPLLRAFTAVVHGYTHVPRGGFTHGFPTDLRGHPTALDLYAAEAADAVRTLARAAGRHPPH